MISGKYCPLIENMSEEIKQLRPRLVTREGPIPLHDHMHHEFLRRNWLTGRTKFASSGLFAQITPTKYHLSVHLELVIRQKIFSNGESAKMTFEDFINSNDLVFSISDRTKLLLRWQIYDEFNHV